MDPKEQEKFRKTIKRVENIFNKAKYPAIILSAKHIDGETISTQISTSHVTPPEAGRLFQKLGELVLSNWKTILSCMIREELTKIEKERGLL